MNNNNSIFLSENKKINTAIPVNDNSLLIAQKFVDARRASTKHELKSDDNTLRLNFINNIVNLIKSADITLNMLHGYFTLADNKVSGRNKTDLKKKDCCEIIDEILLTGRYTEEESNKPLFLKGVRYYHIEKKAFYEFKDIGQWKEIEKDFKKWSLQYIKVNGFILDLIAKKVYKDEK